jgi:glucose/arabinose dehydrogenase
VLDGDVLAEPFLDLSALVASVGLEDGMLGLAFHPRFADTGIFFVTYTPARGRWTLARYRVSEDPNRADAESAVVLLAVPEPGFRHFGGHYGGMLGFGPDGYLYVSVGDGGTRGDDELYDPDRHAQDLGTLMGKLLRIDVDAADPYGIPPDNPFVDTPGARPEVWAYGLRNPWRFAFDPRTGDLLVGDVGLVATEEIDRLPAGRGGLNFGWPELEGVACTPIHPACEPSRFVGPIFVYDHRDGCAVIGGGVVRGHPDLPLDGSYLLGDYCSGTIWAIRPDGAGQWGVVMIRESTMRISSFGRDASGNLYLTDLGNGVLYRIAPQTP